jgi:hypothetical protein
MGENTELALRTGDDDMVDVARKQLALGRDQGKMQFISHRGA